MGNSSLFRGTAAGISSSLGSIRSVRIPFLFEPSFRPGVDKTKDARFVNCYFDPMSIPVLGDTKYWLTKRPGYYQLIWPVPSVVATALVGSTTYTIKTIGNTDFTLIGATANTVGLVFTASGAGTGTGTAVPYTQARGIISWKGDVYSVFGNKIYKNTTDLGVTLAGTTGRCGLSFTRPGAANQYVCVNDGVKLYCIAATSGTVTTVTTNFPTPNTGDFIYKDGYFFVLKSDNTLWSCELDDPTTWDPTKWITSQMLNSSGVGLANQTNVMFVFGTTSFQAFYDNANATGSPMNNNEAAMQQIGCAAQGSIVSDEAVVTWVSNTTTGAYSVYTLDGITGVREIGYPALNRLIRAENTDVSKIYAKMIRTAGRRFYLLQLPTQNKRTFVYDYDTNLWVEWENAAGTDIFPLFDSYQHLGTLIFQHPQNGWIYTVDQSVNQDDATNFTVLARFNRFDFDTVARKFVQRINLIGDKQTSTCNVSLQYSDDDYITLSTARTLDMSLTRSFCSNLGNFRRRSWQISYAGNTPLRVEALEMKVRLGDD